ncbi:hypothetical protein EX30DRAFT_128787 [Ascodesmis nigricans]|uniref:Uncharacterized protein n=1 Tax=Ascodesmis nigricans TaxID=341454 RepID=A0A4S2MP41_9PEZI|nr:hypothetical protein EX30DRAFT_128787 [Ascodesmis nigricans]
MKMMMFGLGRRNFVIRRHTRSSGRACTRAQFQVIIAWKLEESSSSSSSRPRRQAQWYTALSLTRSASTTYDHQHHLPESHHCHHHHHHKSSRATIMFRMQHFLGWRLAQATFASAARTLASRRP